MGFFSDIGEALFGTKSKDQARELTADAAGKATSIGADAKKFGEQFAEKGSYYDKATTDSTGTSAADFMNKARTSAAEAAEAQGQTAATQGSQAALRAARTSGLSKGQAALAAGQQAGDLYTNSYGQGLQQGIQNYGQATSQLSGLGSEMAGRQQAALNTRLGSATGQANIASNQNAAAQQQSANTWGTIGTLAGAAAGMLSDENAKQNIQEVGKENKFKFSDLKDLLSTAGSFNSSAATKNSSSPAAAADINAIPAADNNQFANNLNAGVSFGKVLSNSDKVDTIMKAIPSIVGVVGKMSDENAKQNIQEVGFGSGKANKFNAKEMSEGLNKYIVENNPTSNTFGQGLKTGQVIGKGVKSIFEKKDDEKLSDRHAKINVSEIIDIEDIAKKVRPVKFEYKPEIVAEGKAEDGEHLGVIAQDLEKTALASAVKEGDDGLKRIDTAELSPAVLNLVIQLARKVEKLEGEK